MASGRKQPEGIALLSMYNDEEDDEMEDVEEGVEEGKQQEDEADARAAEEDSMVDADRMGVTDSSNGATPPVANDGSTPPERSKFGTSTPQQPPLSMMVSPQEQRMVSVDSRRRGRGTLAIVDYGHDEVAMSPEPEEGEINGSGRVMYGDELQTANSDLLDRTPSGTVQVLTPSNQVDTPQFSEPLKSDTMNNDAVNGSDGAEYVVVDREGQKPVDALESFLPPPTKAKCSEDLQRRINRFLELKKSGKSFNAEVRNRKDYRNPDFLSHAVTYQDIDEIGSCFSKDVFDPHGYDPSDFYVEIEADMRRESERKEQERKKAQKVDFISGGTQPGIIAAPRINIPVTGSAVTAAVLHVVPPTADVTTRDGRPNKKSKWDKVDTDRKIPLPSVGQDAVSTVGAHAALLSAANAGGGYMLFAQQKRREAEERRSTDRKLDRRS
ncbi:hypothetical protein L6164_017441 [Bauhinia variegata]|uniref:Uncharacterized protein n=1 Tax=Bauhinia variegata TaxID=167791 RepID=A0ACB9NCW8_BAUVA|nr:hypothetical protein L6164_017441 [Bauhinia variegata]